MTWITAKKFFYQESKEPKITISAKTNKIYFNSYVMKHFFSDKRKVLVRYSPKEKLMAFQPVNGIDNLGGNAYCLAKADKVKGARLIYGGCILKQFDIQIKENQYFIPHWDSKIEWLIINLNGNGGNDERNKV